MKHINEILLGDAIKIMRKMPDKCIDLILTDPPYQFLSDNTHGGGIMTKGNKKHLDKLKTHFGMEYNPTEFLEETKRVLKKMNMYIFTNRHLLVNYINFAKNNGYSWDILLWLKSNPMPLNGGKYLLDKEYIMFMRETGSVFNSKLGYENYFTYFSHPIGRKGKVSKHATEKPIDPIKKWIQISSNEGDLILDPYAGSCTTAVACRGLGRKYIMIDNTKEWIEFGRKRLESLSSSETLASEEIRDLYIDVKENNLLVVDKE